MFLAKTKNRGFTLLEMSIVVVIIGIVLSTMTTVLPTLISSGKIKQSRAVLERFELALKGYVMANGRLPCPDTNNDGNENRNIGIPLSPDNDTCVSYVGNIPFRTLGISSGNDPWNRPIKYGVNQRLIATTSGAGANNVCTVLNGISRGIILPPSGITSWVYTADSNGTSNQSNMAYVIVSGGPKDLDGDNSDGFFDGQNEGTDLGFDNPERVYGANNYDDLVVATSFTQLNGQTCSGSSSASGGGGPSNPVAGETLCGNGLDDDNDGVADCNDPDCCLGTSDTNCTGLGICTIANDFKITTTSLPVATINSSYVATIEATGGTPNYQWSIGSPNPISGISFQSPSNSRLVGTINVCSGSYRINVNATDSGTPQDSDSRTFTLTVVSDLAIVRTSGDNNAEINWSLASQTETFLASGTHLGNINWTLSGTGSSNFSVVSSGTASCTLKKKSTAPAGSYTINLIATDSSCSTNVKSKPLNIIVTGSGVGTGGEIKNVTSSLKFADNVTYPKVTPLHHAMSARRESDGASFGLGNQFYITHTQNGNTLCSLHYLESYAGGINYIRSKDYGGAKKLSPITVNPPLINYSGGAGWGVDHNNLAIAWVATADGHLHTSSIVHEDDFLSLSPGFNLAQPVEVSSAGVFDSPDMLEISPGIFVMAVTACRNPGCSDSTGYLQTGRVKDNGEITVTTPFSYKMFPDNFSSQNHPFVVDTSSASPPAIIKVEGANDIYVFAYGTLIGPNLFDGRLTTVKILPDGTFPSPSHTTSSSYPFIDSMRFAGYASEPEIVHVTGNIYAIAYRNDLGSPNTPSCAISTVQITSEGMISLLSSEYLQSSEGCISPDIILVDSNVVAVAYSEIGIFSGIDPNIHIIVSIPNNSLGGVIKTYEISDIDGSITPISSKTFENSSANVPQLIHFNEDYFGIVYYKNNYNGWIKAIEIKR